MVNRLPPLRSIEAFVAVARSTSLAQAAEQLNITKSAVSRRIQALESALGVRLFRRTSRTLELTADGSAYLAATGPALDALLQAAAELPQRKLAASLRVTLPQSFASGWLIPRLPRFYERHPDIELRLDSLGYFEGLPGDSVDVSIRISKGPHESLHSERFLDVVQYPVCSPAVVEQHPLRSARDLAGHTLLHLATMPDAWPEWLAVAGAPGMEPRRHQFFDTMPLVMDAAANGLGVAMAIEALCRDDVRSGRLVAPFAERLDGVRGMYFVCRRRDLGERPVRTLRDWMFAEAAA